MTVLTRSCPFWEPVTGSSQRFIQGYCAARPWEPFVPSVAERRVWCDLGRHACCTHYLDAWHAIDDVTRDAGGAGMGPGGSVWLASEEF